MTSDRFDLLESMAVLARSPSAFHALLSGLPAAWLDATEGPETFSPRDNVGHLIHGEITDWIPRARLILAQGSNRTFESFDRFGHRTASEGKTLEEMLAEFASLRAANLDTLRSWNLGVRELALEGVHPSLGPVTLRQLIATWVVHDLGHLAQTARVMARRHADEVGPWKAYLPVLTR